MVKASSPLSLLNEHKNLEAFVEAIKAGKIQQKQQTYNKEVTNALQELLNRKSERNRLEGHGRYVHSVNFSPNGKTLVSGSDDKKLQQLSQSIKGHATKMVSVAKMKCDQRDQDRTYAMQAEVRGSLCSLASEKRQMIIQMQAEKAKNNAVMEKVYSDLITEIEDKEIEEANLLNLAITTPSPHD